MSTRRQPAAIALTVGGLLAVLAACSSVSAGGGGAQATTGTPTSASGTGDACSARPLATPVVPVASTPAAPANDDLTPLSDEFNDAARLASWTNLSTTEGWPNQIETLDVNTTSPGALYLVPYISTWFEEYHKRCHG